MKPLLWLLAFTLLALQTRACIWDAESLNHEKSRSKDLATTILGEPLLPDDPPKLRARIEDLQAHRDETNAAWWNNLAGAYLRLNQPADAVKILEPIVAKFPNDYGIHANLGTAYHLLGRYPEAEKEIARDLEINPDAHFGLEKYHLALLQYLARDARYQSRHFYVDELTSPFWDSHNGPIPVETDEYFTSMAKSEYTNGLADAESDLLSQGTNYSNWNGTWSFQILAEVCALDEKPAYEKKWNLAENTNFEAGVIYMAQMNPHESAAFEMLGLAAWQKHDYHLAVSAFQKAIALGSPKSGLLQAKISALNDYMARAQVNSNETRVALVLGTILLICMVLFPLLLIWYIFAKIRDRRQTRQRNESGVNSS